MASKWFDEVFLPSLIDKAKKNPAKYQNRVILSEKQREVCIRNMTPKSCHGDYGEFSMFVHETNTHKFQMSEAGKYTFLYITDK